MCSVDEKRIQSWLNANRLQLPLRNHNSDSSESTVTHSEKSVKISPEAPQIRYSFSLDGTYAMAALLSSGGKDVVAIVTVERAKDSVLSIDYVDITRAINGRL